MDHRGSAKSKQSESLIRIGNWTLEPGIRSMSGIGRQFSLSNSSTTLLLLLYQRREQVVKKEELMRLVWPDVLVSEDSLTKSVSELRKILILDKTQSVQIITIRGIGYRLDVARRKGLFTAKRLAIPVSLILGGLIIIGTNGLIPSSRKSDVNITNNLGEQRGPRISPDGTKVLYASISQGWNDFDIHYKSVGEEQSVKFAGSDAAEIDPIWSPDGKEVAFIRHETERISIISKNLDDASERVITTLESGSGLSALDWSAKRGTLIFSDKSKQGPLAIFETYPDDQSAKTQITSPEEGIIGDHSPKVSPNGKMLVFIRIHKRFPFYQHLIPGEGEVFIKNEQGLRQLTDLNSAISGISWVDDEHLVFAAAHNFYSFRIYQLNIRTGKREVIHETKQIIRNLDYSYSTKSLTFESWDIDHKIWKVWRNKNGVYLADALFEKEGREWSPAISPDGSELAFMTDRGNGAVLTIENLETGIAVQADSGVIGNISWSSSGETLLFEKITSDSSFIYTFNRNNKTPVLVLGVAGRYSFPFWSENDAAIYFSSEVGNRRHLYRHNFEDGVHRLVDPENNLSKGLFLRDHMLHTRSGHTGLWSGGRDNQNTRLVDLHPQDVFNWDAQENMVFMVERDPFFQSTLVSFDLEKKVKETLFSLPGTMAIDFAGLSVSAEMDRFYVTLNVKKRSDIMLLREF